MSGSVRQFSKDPEQGNNSHQGNSHHSKKQPRSAERQNEYDAYSAVLSAFWAQGELSWAKDGFLIDLRRALHIDDRYHQTEILRLQSNDTLNNLAELSNTGKRNSARSFRLTTTEKELDSGAETASDDERDSRLRLRRTADSTLFTQSYRPPSLVPGTTTPTVTDRPAPMAAPLHAPAKRGPGRPPKAATMTFPATGTEAAYYPPAPPAAPLSSPAPSKLRLPKKPRPAPRESSPPAEDLNTDPEYLRLKEEQERLQRELAALQGAAVADSSLTE